jgi:hypothetical protein
MAQFSFHGENSQHTPHDNDTPTMLGLGIFGLHEKKQNAFFVGMYDNGDRGSSNLIQQAKARKKWYPRRKRNPHESDRSATRQAL